MTKEKFCPNCNKFIEGKRKDAKFCSRKCKKTYWAKMKRMFPQGKPSNENKNKGPIEGTLEEIISEPFDSDYSYGWKNKMKRKG